MLRTDHEKDPIITILKTKETKFSESFCNFLLHEWVEWHWMGRSAV